MKKLKVFLLCWILLLSACKPTPTEEPESPPDEQTVAEIVNPMVGFYEGTTDQDKKISIWVEEIDGAITVTGFLYDITIQGTGWSSELFWYQKIDCKLPVESGKFMGYLEMSNPGDTAEVSGLFSSDTTIVGRLRHTHRDEQVGSATADIEFEAQRTGGIETAKLPEPDALPLAEAEPSEEIPTEEPLEEMPTEEPLVEVVVLSGDEVWFNSHPSGAEVYVIPQLVDLYDVKIDEIIQPINMIGSCPVIDELLPGEYYVVFVYTSALYDQDGLVLPPGSDPTFAESLPFDGNSIKQTSFGENESVKSIRKLYTLSKTADESNALISLAVPVPEDERHTSSPSIYPSITAVGSLPIRYGFDELSMRESIQKDLDNQNLTSIITSDMIDEMITVLLRVGKVKLTTDEIDILIQMNGYSGNGWSVTVYS